MLRKYGCWCSVTLFVMCLGFVSAQDTHYWTHQFGTRSALMSGAVVGGIFDNTMIYYNPGALGYLQNTTLTINANAYHFEKIVIENALGQQADFNSVKIKSLPLVAGGMINLKNRRLKIGYGFLSPVDFSFNGIARLEGKADLLEEVMSPGEEEYVGETSVSSTLKELMVILGGGYKISDNFSIGLSNIVTVRSRNYNRAFSVFVFGNTDEFETMGRDITQNITYYNLRYSAKFGLMYVRGPWRWGLTLTSPSVNLGGEGTTASKATIQNIEIGGREEPVSGVATARQKLETEYKSPFSAALGLNYRGDKFGVGLAAQYFGKVDIYNVLDPKPGSFVRPSDAAPVFTGEFALSAPEGAESVVNFAAGYENYLSERWTLYISGRTDFSYFDEDTNVNGIETSISSWDIYHLTSGFAFRKGGSQISFGVLFSQGIDKSYVQQGNISNLTTDNLIRDTLFITKAKYSSFGFLLGFTYSFLNADQEKEQD